MPLTNNQKWGSILGPVLPDVFVNDFDVRLEGILTNFVDNTELRGTVDSLEGRKALQRENDKSNWLDSAPGMVLQREMCKWRRT